MSGRVWQDDDETATGFSQKRGTGSNPKDNDTRLRVLKIREVDKEQIPIADYGVEMGLSHFGTSFMPGPYAEVFDSDVFYCQSAR